MLSLGAAIRCYGVRAAAPGIHCGGLRPMAAGFDTGRRQKPVRAEFQSQEAEFEKGEIEIEYRGAYIGGA